MAACPLRFPRLYAAASLKPTGEKYDHCHGVTFSAALCRGLIEADFDTGKGATDGDVFRGFMPRPH